MRLYVLVSIKNCCFVKVRAYLFVCIHARTSERHDVEKCIHKEQHHSYSFLARDISSLKMCALIFNSEYFALTLKVRICLYVCNLCYGEMNLSATTLSAKMFVSRSHYNTNRCVFVMDIAWLAQPLFFSTLFTNIISAICKRGDCTSKCS